MLLLLLLLLSSSSNESESLSLSLPRLLVASSVLLTIIGLIGLLDDVVVDERLDGLLFESLSMFLRRRCDSLKNFSDADVALLEKIVGAVFRATRSNCSPLVDRRDDVVVVVVFSDD